MIHTLEKMAEHKIVSFIRNLQEEAWCSLPIGGMHIPVPAR